VSAGALKRLLDCERRLWLAEHARGRAGARTEHDDLLGEKNRTLEDEVADAIPGLVGPMQTHGVSFDEAAAETARLLRDTDAPIRRPVLQSADGVRSATPGFILREGEALVVRDVRLAHRPEKRRDNRVRVAWAGWLAREVSGREVVRLEIVNGLGRVVEIAPEPDEELAALTARVLELMGETPEPELLLSHSHCQHCDHYAHCWDRAQAERRVEVVPSVTPPRAVLLRAEGVRTFDELATRTLESFSHRELREAPPIMLAEARAFASGAPVWLRDPGLPIGRTPVWFDVESDADGEASTVPVYLWGLAVGEASEPESIMSELSVEGDREGWQRFMARAIEVFERHPNAVWVHWNVAETMWIDRYSKRLGASPEFERLMRAPGATFDLHKALERSVRLPLRSTSVKYVAPWLGFEWGNPDADAAWSTAQLHRARAATDPAARARLLAEVARYNADDLWAMRVVWRFLEEQDEKQRRSRA
jgi:predicted RecB family nuclease